MFGVIPAHQHVRPGTAEIYGARALGSVVAALGVGSLLLLALMPELGGGQEAGLLGLPLALAGLVGLLLGYPALATRLEVAPDGLVLEAPGWRIVPLPPVRQLRLAWDEIDGVRHRTEVYRLGPFRLPLDVFAIETARGRVLLGGYYLWELEPVLIEIAHRAGRPWCEEAPVEAGLLRTLCSGPPPWAPLGTAVATSERIQRVARFARSR